MSVETSDDWFEGLFGFREGAYPDTRARFEFEGETLVSRANGGKWAVGVFGTPTLASLRSDAIGLRPGTLEYRHEVVGDVLEIHALTENANATFQVASQLNCLEFADPRETPEDGVTQYASDPTQGPACSLAAAAATVVRNYFVEVDGVSGQTHDRQLNNLEGVQAALGDAGTLIRVRNGYTFSTPDDLRALGEALANVDRDDLMGALRIGFQSDVEVTFARRFAPPAHRQRVSQAFCSALSCGYASGSLAEWRPIAELVLDGAYEATLLAAILDCARNGSGRVWLTLLGGGAFGNDKTWIARAIGRALALHQHRALDVRIAHHRRLDREMVELINEARQNFTPGGV